MDRLTRFFGLSKAALASLHEVLQLQKSILVRDAAIQRFQFTFETIWKTTQLFLRRRDALELASPNSVFRAAGGAGILTPQEVKLALQMVRDRNLTVHIYYEHLAERVYGLLPGYADLMGRLLQVMDDPQQLALLLEEQK